MRSSAFSGDRLGRKSRFRLRSPSRRPAAQATGLATGTKLSVPRCSWRRPSANSARICRMATGPAVSLPCTPPSTSTRGPGRSAWKLCSSMTGVEAGWVAESVMAGRGRVNEAGERSLGERNGTDGVRPGVLRSIERAMNLFVPGLLGTGVPDGCISHGRGQRIVPAPRFWLGRCPAARGRAVHGGSRRGYR